MLKSGLQAVVFRSSVTFTVSGAKFLGRDLTITSAKKSRLLAFVVSSTVEWGILC